MTTLLIPPTINTISTIERTEAKPKLEARWLVENNELVCKWIVR